MFFKQSLILLFAGIVVSAIAADVEEYDVESLRSMLRSQQDCMIKYLNFSRNCTLVTNYRSTECINNKDAAESRVKENALENNSKLISRSDNSCNYIRACNTKEGNVDDMFDCVTGRSMESVGQFNNISYDARNMHNAYQTQMVDISSTMSSCINHVTQASSAAQNQGLDAFRNCLDGVDFTLVIEVPDAALPTTTPVVTEKPAITTLAVSEKPKSSTTTTKPQVTKVTEKPAAESEENEHN